MTSVRNALVAGASALGMLAASVSAEAAPANSPKTIGGVDYDNIQTVGHHGWGGGGGGFGGRGFGGGGRHFGGGGFGGSGFASRGYYGGGRHWGGGGGYPRYGYYGGHHHHHGWGGGGYLAAGALGLVAGAALSDPYYGGYGYYDRGYYDDGYYGGAQCRVYRRAYDRWGRPIRVIRYVPC